MEVVAAKLNSWLAPPVTGTAIPEKRPPSGPKAMRHFGWRRTHEGNPHTSQLGTEGFDQQKKMGYLDGPWERYAILLLSNWEYIYITSYIPMK